MANQNWWRLFLALLLFSGAKINAQEKAIAFTGARVIPISGPEIPQGTIVIRNGKIERVGPTAAVAIPADAERRDVSGKVIMPGLVDSHSHIGSAEGADSAAPIQPDVRILDSLDARHSSIQKARAGGLTTVNVMPGSGHLLSGQTLYIKLRAEARVVDDVVIRLADGSIAGGIKMANGSNPRRASPFPGSKAKAAALVREQFVKAIEYRDKLKKAEGDVSKRPARDLRLESLVDVLDGKRIVQHHTHSHNDILTVLRLADEFKFRVVLHHVSDGWKVPQEIANAKAACSVIVIDSPGGKIEAKDSRLETAAILDKAGVLVGLHTDDGVTDSRLFLRSAALAVRAGLPREKALQAVTIANARMLDLQDRVGTLEPGKDADLVILSGDPFSVYTNVLQTWVEGRKAFDRELPKDRIYQVGGPGASYDSRYPSEVEEY
ncbi:MAG: amidohydrolase family protein [Bryobacteraceae bacterium]|nr:amidohydrolase family protein [Bryobacteraceae bacterium]